MNPNRKFVPPSLSPYVRTGVFLFRVPFVPTEHLAAEIAFVHMGTALTAGDLSSHLNGAASEPSRQETRLFRAPRRISGRLVALEVQEQKYSVVKR